MSPACGPDVRCLRMPKEQADALAPAARLAKPALHGVHARAMRCSRGAPGAPSLEEDGHPRLEARHRRDLGFGADGEVPVADLEASGHVRDDQGLVV
jgi:hypothetical protein